MAGDINHDVDVKDEKPLWGSVKKLIMGSVFFVLKGLLVCLREGYMKVNWPRIIDTGQQNLWIWNQCQS